MNYFNKNSQQTYNEIKHKLLDFYDIYAYEELCLPLFEKYDNYMQYKTVSEESLLKFIDRSGNILVIRPDATFHVLKTIQSMNSSSNRYCYSTNIFRFRENNFEINDVLQSGIELFNSSSPYADAEVIALAVESLKMLGIENIHIDIGHSGFVHAFLKEIGISSDSDIAYYHRLIDSKNIVTLNNSLKNTKADDKHLCQIFDLAMLFGDYDDVMKKAANICINKKMEHNLTQLSDIYTALKAFGADNYVHLDLGFSNPMNYYSGMIFKGYCNGHGETVISGGRYDTLAQIFTNKTSACGFGQNIDVTIDILLKNRYKPPCSKTVYIKGEDSKNKAVLSKLLRSAGIRCILSFSDEECFDYECKVVLNVGREHTEVIKGNDKKTYSTEDLIKSKGAQLC